jgi:ABC-2 type transport system permease protein
MIAIYTLWLREVNKYFRSKSRIIGSLGQPILFLVALGFGLGPVFQKAGEGNYIQFLVPGIISMSILFLAIFSGISVIWDRQFGFLKETMVAPVPRWQIMLGQTLGGATVAVLQGLIVFAISFLAGFRFENYAILPVTFVFMILIALIFTALGTAIDGIRTTLDGASQFGLMTDFWVLSFTVVILISIGSYLFSKIQI